MIILVYWHLRRLRLHLKTGFGDFSLFLAIMPPPLPQHRRAGRVSESIQKRNKWARSLEMTVLNVKNGKRRELMTAKLRSWKGMRFGWRRCWKWCFQCPGPVIRITAVCLVPLCLRQAYLLPEIIFHSHITCEEQGAAWIIHLPSFNLESCHT